jgi:hypothetical protein
VAISIHPSYLPVLEVREHLESLGQFPGTIALQQLPDGGVNLNHLDT